MTDSKATEQAVGPADLRDDISDGKVATEITQVQGDSHFHETTKAAPLDPWSRASVQLYLILLVAALNATASGFDGVSTAPKQRKRSVAHAKQSIFSSINAMDQYERYFHHTELGSSTGM